MSHITCLLAQQKKTGTSNVLYTIVKQVNLCTGVYKGEGHYDVMVDINKIDELHCVKVSSFIV